MTAFVFTILLGVGLLVFAAFLAQRASKGGSNAAFFTLLRKLATVLAVIVFIWAVAGTSVVWVPSGKIAIFERTYLGKSLAPGRIVAIEGELGPQAKIMTAGFHVAPFITL